MVDLNSAMKLNPTPAQPSPHSERVPLEATREAAYIGLLSRVESHLEEGTPLENPRLARQGLLAASLTAHLSPDLRIATGDILVRLDHELGAYSAALRLQDRDPEVRSAAATMLARSYPYLAEERLRGVIEKDQDVSVATTALLLMKGAHIHGADEAGAILMARRDLKEFQIGEVKSILAAQYPALTRDGSEPPVLAVEKLTGINLAEQALAESNPRLQKLLIDRITTTAPVVGAALCTALGYEG